MRSRLAAWVGVLLLWTDAAYSQKSRIDVYANEATHLVSRYLTGACIEDVNHEIYGGLYSQMIFGESFQEPVPSPRIKDFRAYGGTWMPRGEELDAGSGEGPKLVSGVPVFELGEVGVEVCFPDVRNGNAGLILKVSEAGKGADVFNGYEVSLETSGRLVLGRHRHNWEPLRTVPCEVPAGKWIPLVVRVTRNTLDIEVAGKRVLQYEDSEHPLVSGQAGLRTWQRDAKFRNFWIKDQGTVRRISFEPETGSGLENVSGMWRAVRAGSAQGAFSIETEKPFVGIQSQRIAFEGGEGELGIENEGLNRWGLNFIAGQPYEGYVCVRAAKPTEFFVALENRKGGRVYSEKRLRISNAEWQRVDFALTPDANDTEGRFTIKLKKPGSMTLGYVFLQPGPWGRYKGLPDRRDVVEGLVQDGITVLRYGGSMVNHAEYRWKKMIGPRERRPPHHGTWYQYSSNGWGILDFLDLCEAAGFLPIPAFNMDETPGDMADFIEYVNGRPESKWRRRRVADGHPKPYGLKYLELGNEERVDETYWQKFEKLAQALWAKDEKLIVVVGDFQYEAPIRDPFNFKGAASSITTLAAHQKILALAKAHNREVWFDLHLNTEGPDRSPSVLALPTFIDALNRISDGARHQVVVFELNAANHGQKRALANALAIHTAERLNLPIVTSANGLQPDGQNDNGWDQGLLFLNPSQVWLQPPGYVVRMLSTHYQPLLVRTEVRSPGEALDVNAKRSEDGSILVLQVVNRNAHALPVEVRLRDFSPKKSAAMVEELSASLEKSNDSREPGRVQALKRNWDLKLTDSTASYTLQPHSFTILRFE